MSADATTTSGAGRFVGHRVPRREDPRLLTGHGRYADDVTLPGMLHLAFVRSNSARGTIRSVDVAEAAALPGVRAVLTAAELNERCGPLHAGSTGPSMVAVPERPLADTDVRYVGEPIVVVVAESRAIAEDACELVVVDVELASPVLDLAAAVSDGSEIVHPEHGTNVASEIPEMPNPALDEAFAAAAHVVTRTFPTARVTNVPMEPRGLVAAWDPSAGEMRIWPSNQAPHEVKGFCSRVLGIPEHQVHVQMGDVGGAFGQKMYGHRDEACVLLAAHHVGRPVKWIEDRRENLVGANQARCETATISLAVADDGTFLAAKVHLLEDVGAFPVGGTSGVAMLASICFTGPYRIPLLGFTAQAVYTNTVGKAPYRGPWAIETIAREQMVDHVAREIGMDPIELRRHNLIRAEDQPHLLPSGLPIDNVTPVETLDQALGILDLESFRARQRAARDEGRYLGVGVSVCVEPSAVAFGSLAMEQATIRIDPTGTVLVLMGTGSHGHSLETTIPQIVADHLGCDIADVRFVQGDTDATPHGPGTGGSRSAVIAGGAALGAAARMHDRLVQIAAHLLEASPDDLEVADSRVSVRGTPSRGVTFSEIAGTVYNNPAGLPPDTEPDLEVSHRFASPAPITWSNATHVATCEVDPATGTVRLDRYVVSEDCGVMINPMVVEGQIAGGVVQGIGQALLEDMAYDADGNPLATTFLDYLMPTASEVPVIEFGHIETPAPTPGGYKGMGEGGAIAAPAAVANAVNDALAPLGASLTALPITLESIRSQLRKSTT